MLDCILQNVPAQILKTADSISNLKSCDRESFSKNSESPSILLSSLCRLLNPQGIDVQFTRSIWNRDLAWCESNRNPVNYQLYFIIFTLAEINFNSGIYSVCNSEPFTAYLNSIASVANAKIE